MKKLIAAPMATLSHEAFRICAESFGGCDEYFTEMINATSLVQMGPFEKYYLMNGPAPQKIVWQLTGWDSVSLAKAAAVVAQSGGKGIDINMGCSAPQIYKTGAGVAWMLKPLEETREAVKAVKHALDESEKTTGTKLRFSVKCRLGPDDFTDQGFFSFTDMLVEEGVQCISLHPRTVKEKLRGLPRYKYAELLAQRHPELQVYVNGEVKDFNSASHAALTCPHAEGIMIARAAAVKPWIFDEIKSRMQAQEQGIQYQKNHVVDRQQLALDFIDNITKCQPPEFYKTRIQRFFGYYCQQFAFGHYFTSRMQNYKGIEECKNEVYDYFKKQEYERYLEY